MRPMLDPYSAFRQLEREVFHGVPEQPEPSWQRHPNAQVADRLTGRSQLEPNQPSGTNDLEVLGTITYRGGTREIVCEIYDSAADSGSEAPAR